jgi:hypothetical protein
MEKSREEQEEETRIERQRQELAAQERRAAMQQVARTRTRWVKSMDKVKEAAVDLVRSRELKEIAKECRLALSAGATEHERFEAAEAERKATAAQIAAMNRMKEMEKREREEAAGDTPAA